METKKSDTRPWTFVSLARRVDSFSYDRVTREVLKVVDEGKSFVVIDLSKTSFLSLPTIKFLATTAELLTAREGELVLLSPCDRTRRHIEIFASFKGMRCCMNLDEVEKGLVRPKEERPVEKAAL